MPNKILLKNAIFYEIEKNKLNIINFFTSLLKIKHFFTFLENFKNINWMKYIGCLLVINFSRIADIPPLLYFASSWYISLAKCILLVMYSSYKHQHIGFKSENILAFKFSLRIVHRYIQTDPVKQSSN